MGWSRFRDKYVEPVVSSIVAPFSGAGDKLQDVWEDVSGKTAEEAAQRASATQASAMLEQLDYLKEINRMPQELKEQALTKLGTLYGGGEEGQAAQQEMFESAKTSPFYQAMMSGREAGEEGVARGASVTGGLRSGNVQSAMYDYNAQAEQKAIMDAYMQELSGIKGLAGLPTGEQQIGRTMSDIGVVKGQGIMGAAGARQAGTSNVMNTLLGIGGLII